MTTRNYSGGIEFAATAGYGPQRFTSARVDVGMNREVERQLDHVNHIIQLEKLRQRAGIPMTADWRATLDDASGRQ